MLSPPDIAVIGVLALIFFGPDQLPKVARKAGQVMRDVQNTSQSFIREMEKAADDLDMREAFRAAGDDPKMTGPRPPSEKLAEPSPALALQNRDAAFVPAPQPAPPKIESDPVVEVAHEDASGI